MVRCADSPGVPPSATANELFKGFSYIAPPLLTENMVAKQTTQHANPQAATAAAQAAASAQSMEVVAAPPLSRVRSICTKLLLYARDMSSDMLKASCVSSSSQ